MIKYLIGLITVIGINYTTTVYSVGVAIEDNQKIAQIENSINQSIRNIEMSVVLLDWQVNDIDKRLAKLEEEVRDGL